MHTCIHAYIHTYMHTYIHITGLVQRVRNRLLQTSCRHWDLFPHGPIARNAQHLTLHSRREQLHQHPPASRYYVCAAGGGLHADRSRLRRLVCCSGAVCCSVLQCVAVCCSVLQCHDYVVSSAIPVQCVAVSCSVLQCVAVSRLCRLVCCSGAVCYSVLQLHSTTTRESGGMELLAITSQRQATDIVTADLSVSYQNDERLR